MRETSNNKTNKTYGDFVSIINLEYSIQNLFLHDFCNIKNQTCNLIIKYYYIEISVEVANTAELGEEMLNHLPSQEAMAKQSRTL